MPLNHAYVTTRFARQGLRTPPTIHSLGLEPIQDLFLDVAEC